MKMKTMALAVLAAAGTATADVAIKFDPAQPAFKDQRTSRCGVGLGYAGSITDNGDVYNREFLAHPDALWKSFEDAGAYFVKQWSANQTWALGMALEKAYGELKTDAERAAFSKKTNWTPDCAQKKIFQFRKDHGVRILLCIEQYSCYTGKVKVGETGKVSMSTSSEIDDVKKSILEYVQWIVDNGFKDQVAGFELGNEPYFGSDPENYAERWSQIVPDIKKVFPEVDIGFSIAEYRDGDPDIAAVRARATNVDEWFEGGSEFGFSKINQWSGRFIVAFSNCLDLCSHAIYHFYGGDAAYGVGPSGFARIRNFAKAFPEVKDKKIWITEWRERSDEDCRCQQMHSSTVFKAHYLQACLCQPEIDGICLHSCNSLAGGICMTDGNGRWCVQWDPAGRDFPDPDFTGRPRIETGPCGPVFKIYNQALMKHPLVMDHGTWNGGTITNSSYWSCNVYYAYHHKMVHWLTFGEKGKKPESTGNAEWTLLTNPDRTSVALLVCNSTRKDWKPTLEVKGRKLGKAHYRTFWCPEEKEFLHQVPGEPRPTVEKEYDGDPTAIVVPAHTIATLVFPLEKE